MTTTPFDVFQSVPTQLTNSQEEALARMSNIIEISGLGVLSGEIGSGKSTVLRALSSSLPSTKFSVIYICVANLVPRTLYSQLVEGLGEQPKFGLQRMKQQWQSLLENELMDGKKVVLLIDEAHDMPGHTLLELRFLLNHKMDAAPCFSLILSGQPHLRSSLRLKALEAISQRVKMQYHVTGMTLDETAEYIRKKLADASVQQPLFGESAIKIIYDSTQGIPRVVDQVCRYAFHTAIKNGDQVIEEKHIVAVLADMDRQRGTKN